MAKLNIYIVEDDLLTAVSLKHMLLSLGHTVCGTATSYEQAVYDLGRMEVDLVIADIMLNGFRNGIELAQYIKTHLQIPFIFQSSIASTAIISQALNVYPSAYITKPVNKQALFNAISLAANNMRTVA